MNITVVRIVIERGSLVDHCVCMDGNRKLTLDSEDIFAIKLNAESLKFFAGPGAQQVFLVEMFENHI